MRKTTTKTQTVVRQVITSRTGLTLGDLRYFVAEADGLPGDDTRVSVETSPLRETGVRDYTLTARHTIEEPA